MSPGGPGWVSVVVFAPLPPLEKGCAWTPVDIQAIVTAWGWSRVREDQRSARNGHDPQTIGVRLTGAGYTHELAEVTERVAGGHTESEIMPLANTVAVQDVLGEIADQLGVRVIEGPAELP